MKDWIIQPDGWVTGSIFGFAVEHDEVPRPANQPYLRLDETSKLVNLHTSEGYTIDALVATLKANGFAGQWCVGNGRIVQTRPVWAQGSLLLGGSTTNEPMRMEVEQVAFSEFKLWQPAAPTFGPMAALAALYHVEFGVPLVVPVATWKDDGSDLGGKFYGPNARRTQAQTIGLANLQGFIHHCEVPLNLHADCGAYDRHALFAAAQALADSLDPPTPPEEDMTPEQAQMLSDLNAVRQGLVYELTGKKPTNPAFTTTNPDKYPNWYAGGEVGRFLADHGSDVQPPDNTGGTP